MNASDINKCRPVTRVERRLNLDCVFRAYRSYANSDFFQQIPEPNGFLHKNKWVHLNSDIWILSVTFEFMGLAITRIAGAETVCVKKLYGLYNAGIHVSLGSNSYSSLP